jgi:hypothetical protein
MADSRYHDQWAMDGYHDRSRLSYPRGDMMQSNGGNSLLTTHRISGFESWTFENSNDLPIAGFMRSKVELAPGVTVDFWTTHFEAGSDNCGLKCHKVEVRHLADYVASYSGEWNDHGWNGNAVLIAGDLNMGGPISLEEKRQHDADPKAHPYQGNPGYDYLMTYLRNPRDLWLEAHPQQESANEGYTYDPVTNPLAYDAGRERIDYLLSPTDPHFQRSFDTLRVKHMEVVRWQTPRGINISDHYGLDTTFEVVRKKINLPTAENGGNAQVIPVHLK